jgi:hypothetical protein
VQLEGLERERKEKQKKKKKNNNKTDSSGLEHMTFQLVA